MMDDKEKRENLGAAGVAKMSAHEGVTLAPKGNTGAMTEAGANTVAQKAEELANMAASREAAAMGEVNEAGLVSSAGTNGIGVATSEKVTSTGVMNGGVATEAMTETVGVTTPAGVETAKKSETVMTELPMPPVDPAMMADGLEATVGKKDRKEKKPKISRGAAKMKVEPIDSTPLMMRAPESNEDEDKMTPDQLIAALNDMPSKGIAMSKRQYRWVKLVRGLIWVVVAVTLPIGAAILRRSGLSECLANGTAAEMEKWGKVILYASLGVAGVNLLWGIVRWFRRWNSEKWGIFRVIGKLIKGLIVRVIVFAPIVMATLILIVPAFYNSLTEKFMIERAEIMYSGIMTSDTQEFLYGSAVPCGDFCGEDFTLKPGEAKYYYAMAEEFAGTNVKFVGDAETSMKVLGRQGREWKEIAEFYEEMNYTVTTDAGYDAFAVAIKNTREVIEEPELEDDVPVVQDGSEIAQVKLTVLAESLANDVAVNEETAEENRCLQVNFDKILDFPVKMYQMMKELGAGENVEEVFDGLDRETGTNKLVRHFATVCTREMKTEVDYNKIQMDLEKVVGANWRVVDKVGENSHVSMYVTYRPLEGEATGYFLIRAGEQTELVRIRMEEKEAGV